MPRITLAGRVFYGAATVLALTIATLQMRRFRGGLVTDYGADIFGTAWLYGMFRQGRTVFARGRVLAPGTTAVLVVTGCAASEFAQRAGWFPGVFDPVDLAAYAVSVLACYAVDDAISLGTVDQAAAVTQHTARRGPPSP